MYIFLFSYHERCAHRALIGEIPCCIIGIMTGIIMIIFSFNPHTPLSICFYCLRVLHQCDLFCLFVFSLE